MDGRRTNLLDYQVETAGLQSGSTGNDSGGHFCESHLDDGASRSLHDKHQGMSNFVLRNQIVTLFVTQNSESEFRERFRLLEFSISSRKSRSDQGTSRSRLDA